MSLNKWLVITCCLFGIASASPVEQEEAPYSIANIWKSSRSDCICKCEPDWVVGVQKYHDNIIHIFSTFPEPLAKQADDLVKNQFEAYLTKLVNCSNSNSTMLSSASSAILDAVGDIEVRTNTADGVIKDAQRELPILMKAYRGVVSNLSKVIGVKEICTVNDAIAELECANRKYITEFLQNDLKKEVDFEPVTRSAQKLTKTIARVAETNKCSSPDFRDASTVLNLVLDHLLILYNGLSGCSQAVLYKEKSKELPICKYDVTVRFSINKIKLPVTVTKTNKIGK